MTRPHNHAPPACNLLPRSIRRDRLLRRAAKRWGAATLVVFGLLALHAAWHVHKHIARESELHELRVATSPVRGMLEQTEQRRTALTETRRQLAVRERLVPTENTLHVLDLVARGWRETGGRLTIDSVVVERTPTGSGPHTGEAARVELGGVAVDDVTLSRFVGALRREAAEGRVELQSGVNESVDGRAVRRYVVVCTFE